MKVCVTKNLTDQKFFQYLSKYKNSKSIVIIFYLLEFALTE